MGGDCMTITLYNNLSNKKTINKTIVKISDVTNVRLKENVTILNPVLQLSLTPDIISCNYVYIPDFSRYYFKGDVEFVTNDVVNVYLSVDPLFSFATNIMNSNVTAIRSTNHYDRYLYDNRQASLLTTIKQTKTFTVTPFNPAGLTSQNRTFILHMVSAPAP